MLVLLSVLVPGRRVLVSGFLIVLHYFLRGFFLICLLYTSDAADE